MTELSAPGSGALTLMFDADDTLWENNVYFERAIAAFISYLDHRVHTDEEVRERLNAIEHATIAERGYGLKSFKRSLIICFEQLTEAPVSEEKHRRILSFVDSIAGQEIELLPNVAQTLQELSARHRLLLVTKGDPEEQRDKLTRSGLSQFFSAVEVVPEKDRSCYRRLAQKYNCTSESTWMIGNSPKSDINPSMAAGLNAIFIPHGFTWILEHEVIAMPPPGTRLLEIAEFTELLAHF